MLKDTGYKRSRAAKKLGISTTTLWRKMKLLGLLDEMNS
ncbi:helix-turn-helix domain-containing protein [Pelotomaculum schinkii]